MTDDDKARGHQIKAARERLNLTQEALAYELGHTAKTIGEWERGDSRPRFSNWLRLCARLSIPVDQETTNAIERKLDAILTALGVDPETV